MMAHLPDAVTSFCGSSSAQDAARNILALMTLGWIGGSVWFGFRRLAVRT